LIVNSFYFFLRWYVLFGPRFNVIAETSTLLMAIQSAGVIISDIYRNLLKNTQSIPLLLCSCQTIVL